MKNVEIVLKKHTDEWGADDPTNKNLYQAVLDVERLDKNKETYFRILRDCTDLVYELIGNAAPADGSDALRNVARRVVDEIDNSGRNGIYSMEHPFYQRIRAEASFFDQAKIEGMFSSGYTIAGLEAKFGLDEQRDHVRSPSLMLQRQMARERIERKTPLVVSNRLHDLIWTLEERESQYIRTQIHEDLIYQGLEGAYSGAIAGCQAAGGVSNLKRCIVHGTAIGVLHATQRSISVIVNAWVASQTSTLGIADEF